MLSPFGSNQWRLLHNGSQIATLQRYGRRHVSRLMIPGEDEIVIAPYRHSMVHAVDPTGVELGRIARASWLGRRWEVTSKTWAYELVSHPRPRRWQITVGGTPVAEIQGSLLSYNRVAIRAQLGVPLLVVALAWHVIARPWEAAAAPGTLIPYAEEVQEIVHR